VIAAVPSLLALFIYGLRSGLLTFGGAYTAIPFLQHDAVVTGAWMTNQQFLDGLALSSILPAPLIIFSTFVGYLGGGPLGALVLTIGIFLPAFSFTLIGHNFFEEKFIENKAAHAFLDGVTAGVVGFIAVTTISLFQTAVTDLPSLAIFITALLALYRWKAKAIIPLVMLGAGLLGLLFYFIK
jgi:chromate transporter